MSLIPIVQGGHSTASGFDSTLISNSVWLDGSADCLTKALSSGAAQSKLIISTWVQRNKFSSTAEHAIVTSIGGAGSTSANRLKFEDDGITVHLESGASNVTSIYKTTALYRDIGWYHVLLSIDGDVSDSMDLYVNGIEQTTSITTGSAFTGTLNSFAHSGATQMIGKYNNTVSDFYFLPGYLAQTTMIVGQSIQNGDLAVSDFLGTFSSNGVRIPKADSTIAALATAGGGNSFCLDFANSADLGNDLSSNNNDFTPTSMGSANQSSNTPSKSYPILNVLDPTTATASSGNLNFAGPSADNKAAMRTTIGIPDNSGKFYWEYALTGGSNDAVMVGIAGDGSANGGYDDWVQDITPQVAVYTESSGNVLYEDGSSTNSSFFGSSPTGGDVIGVAYDSDTRKVWFALNNTYAGSGDPAAGSGEAATLSSSGTAFPTVSSRGSSDTLTLRFDSGDFTYSAPTGFNDLNTANLTAFTFSNPTTGSFTGDASTNGPFVFLGFQPSPSDALTINSNSVTYGTDVDLCNNGFKVRSSSSNFNSTGTNTYSLVTTNARQINGEFPPSFGITN